MDRIRTTWFENLSWSESVIVALMLVAFLLLRWLRGAALSDLENFLRTR